MSLRAAVFVMALGALVTPGARPAAQLAAGVRWVWTGGVTARSAVVKARVTRGGIAVRLLLAPMPTASPGAILSVNTGIPHGRPLGAATASNAGGPLGPRTQAGVVMKGILGQKPA